MIKKAENFLLLLIIIAGILVILGFSSQQVGHAYADLWNALVSGVHGFARGLHHK